MQLRELLEHLEHGELRRMGLGGSEASGILPKDYPKILPHINLGLTEIYKRFSMKTGQVTVQQYSQISNYVLHEKFAESNTDSEEPIKYILDSVFKPFIDGDNVLSIEGVYKENGEAYPLNDFKNKFSLFTSGFNTVQIPYPDENNVMTVMYKAGHKKLKVLDSDEQFLSQEVEISGTYLEALLKYIGSSYLTTLGKQEATQDGMLKNQMFEVSCNKIENEGLNNTELSTNENLERNGWV